MQDNFIFVLVRPVFLGNLGSVARVLKNFHFQQLRLVNPPKNYMDSEARRMATGASDILKNAQLFKSLPEAIQDASLILGTTAGRYRDETPIPLVEIIPKVLTISQSNKIAIVFGDERNGLMREELQLCHQIVTIRTNPDFPTLNIAQSVNIVAYEISKQSHQQMQAAVNYPTGLMSDELITQIESLINRIKFTRKFNHAVILKELRALYQRTLPTKREFDILTGLIRRINQKLDQSPNHE